LIIVCFLFLLGLAILGAGASMLLYHYQNIPLMRELVMRLKRLEVIFIILSNGYYTTNVFFCLFFTFFIFRVRLADIPRVAAVRSATATCGRGKLV